jgi:hypothetical protein
LTAQNWSKINVQLDNDTLSGVLNDVYGSGWAFGADDALADLNPNVGLDWDAWQAGNEAAAALLDPPAGLQNMLMQSNIVLKGISDTTMDRIGSALALSLSQGLGARETAKAIDYVINDPSRALTIARTETARALVQSNLSEYTMAGIKQVEWLVADPCPICAQNSGVKVPIGESFPSGATLPPAHPNCVCDIAPVSEFDTDPIGQGRVDNSPETGIPIPEPKSLGYPERKNLVDKMQELFDWKKHKSSDAVREYVGYGYQGINKSLRDPQKWQQIASELTIESTEVFVRQLQQVIEEAPRLLQDVYSYRGIKQGNYVDMISSLKIGDEFVDKGFVSTSLNKLTAENAFASRNRPSEADGMLIRIINPAGTKGLMVGGDIEEEWLLPAGSRFRVIENTGDMITVMVV